VFLSLVSPGGVRRGAAADLEWSGQKYGCVRILNASLQTKYSPKVLFTGAALHIASF